MKIHHEVIQTMQTLITSAFGLVTALAWNEAIASLFKEGGQLYFLRNYGVWAYAIFVTILIVIITIWMGKIATKIKINGEEKK